MGRNTCSLLQPDLHKPHLLHGMQGRLDGLRMQPGMRHLGHHLQDQPGLLQPQVLALQVHLRHFPSGQRCAMGPVMLQGMHVALSIS